LVVEVLKTTTTAGATEVYNFKVARKCLGPEIIVKKEKRLRV
jgi:hypothetical protein